MTSIKRSAAILALLLASCSRSSAVLPSASENALAVPSANGARALQLFVSPLTVPGQIMVFPATANGSVAPNRTIDGFVDNFSLNYFLAYDRKLRRIWGTACLESGATGGPIVAWSEFARGTNAKPELIIDGSKTGLSGCQTGIALDSKGYVYVADLASTKTYPGGQLAVFAPTQKGNVVPARRIFGSKAAIKSPEGVAIDATGRTYVANSCQGFSASCTSGINIYAAGANGNVAPVATIGGKKTNILAAFGVALDSAGNVYVADAGAGAIEVFKAGATGNVAPMRFIAGDKTHIRTPSGIAVDGAGYIYLGNFDQSTSNNSWPIFVFKPNADGNVAPVQIIRVKAKRFDQPSGIALR